MVCNNGIFQEVSNLQNNGSAQAKVNSAYYLTLASWQRAPLSQTRSPARCCRLQLRWGRSLGKWWRATRWGCAGLGCPWAVLGCFWPQQEQPGRAGRSSCLTAPRREVTAPLVPAAPQATAQGGCRGHSGGSPVASGVLDQAGPHMWQGKEKGVRESCCPRNGVVVEQARRGKGFCCWCCKLKIVALLIAAIRSYAQGV